MCFVYRTDPQSVRKSRGSASRVRSDVGSAADRARPPASGIQAIGWRARTAGRRGAEEEGKGTRGKGESAGKRGQARGRGERKGKERTYTRQ